MIQKGKNISQQKKGKNIGNFQILFIYKTNDIFG